jgi:serine/threonine-protein kinase
MSPLGLLKCLARALVRYGANALGLGLVGDIAANVSEEVWREWASPKDEPGRRAEVEAIVQMAAAEFRKQVEAVVQEVAAGLPAEARRSVVHALEELPDRLRRSLRLTGSQGRPTTPPLRHAQDLVSLLTGSEPLTVTPAPLSCDSPPLARVTLTLEGPGEARQFVFEERTTCIIGREKDCYPRFPMDREHQTISRHHCLLDINPPDICVRDLGSRGGTYVNGELLDRRPQGMDREEALKQRFRERNLQDGDELRLCKRAAVFRVSVTAPTLCTTCGAWISDDRKAECRRPSGTYQCRPCAERARERPSPLPVRGCVGCGRDISHEVGARRRGELLCAACRSDPERLMRVLQGEARTGRGDLVAIQGYTILRRLGSGGMGSVWLARHDPTGRQVALKVMLPQVAADERAVKRFLFEMTNTRALDHPNVVRLEDAGYSRGAFFMVLDYCDGGSVEDLMKQRGGPLSVDEAIEITLQALEGLHYAHNVFGPGRGLVHRDLKPPNLFLSGTGSSRVVRVGDYGLAKAFDDAGLSGATRTGEVGGTPYFMARQQVIDFKYAAPEVDVWAMAASLYNMLTGDVPRDFTSGHDPWLVVLETRPVPIRRRRPALPVGLAELIDHALQEEPQLPFKTAAALKQALENVV